jgi:hypothetical protein
MSEQLDQEQEAYSTVMGEALDIALRLADQTRVQSITESIPRGYAVAYYFEDNKTWETYYLKPGYILALFYDDTIAEHTDPFTRRGLEHTDAWILRYDSHYSKWHVDAWNKELANRSFAKLARRLTTD